MISLITIQTDLLSLTEILNQTGNLIVAAQILDGTYVEPVIDKFNKFSSPDKEGNQKEYQFINYNKWSDIVCYRDVYSREMPRETWNALYNTFVVDEIEEPNELTHSEGDEADKIQY